MKKASSLQSSAMQLDMESIGKKIGKLEVTTAHLQKQLSTDCIGKPYVDSKADELNLIYQNEINSLKKGFDQLAALLTESIEGIKSNLIEDIDFKTSNISKLVEVSLERVDNIEQAVTSQSSNQLSHNNSTDAKLKQFNSNLSNELKQFSTELNTAMTKIAFFEKQMNEQSSSVLSKVNSLSNDIKEIKKVLDGLAMYKDNSTKVIDHLQTEVSASQEINSKFHYQTSVLIEEVKGKMNKSEATVKEHVNHFEAIRKEIYVEINNIQGNVNSTLNKVMLGLEEQTGQMRNDLKEFQLKMSELNEDTEKYAHTQFEELSIEVKTMLDINSKEIVKLNDRHCQFEEKVLNKQKDFYDNLNEMEEFQNKKYESIMRVINQNAFNSKY